MRYLCSVKFLKNGDKGRQWISKYDTCLCNQAKLRAVVEQAINKEMMNSTKRSIWNVEVKERGEHQNKVLRAEVSKKRYFIKKNPGDEARRVTEHFSLQGAKRNL